jgi:TRAP-type C4-dicarboxylate transport system permease small subunit
MPARIGWYCEWLTDAMAFVCCVVIAVYATKAAYVSYSADALTIQTLVTPEWWSLVPLPIAFVLLAIEVLFRMERLARGKRAPRQDAAPPS